MGLHRSIIAITTLVLASTPSLAESCSTMRGTCIASYSGADQAGGIKKCTDAANVCVASCKKGQKYFVGPFNGALHPVDTCS
jgi:hypothetical protein